MADTLAQLVRKKYPGAYDDLSDEQLEAKVDAKYPGAYADLPRSKAAPSPTPQPGPPARQPGEMPYYSVPLPDPRVVAATAPIALSPAMGAVGSVLTPLVGRTLAHPVGAGLVGAALGYQHGGVKGAAIEGAIGALGGPLVGRAAQALRLARLLPGATAAAESAAPTVTQAATATPEAMAATEAAVRGARTVSPMLSNVTFSVGEAAPQAAAAAAKAAPTIAGKVIQVAVRGDARKLWAITDAAGNPTQTFTSAHEALKASHAAKRAVALAESAAEAAPVAENVTAAPAATKAIERAPTVAKAAQSAPAASNTTQQAKLMDFAKEIAANNPKVGEKIWIALDKEGNPVSLLTPDQAGAAKRAGVATTWVRNLWR